MKNKNEINEFSILNSDKYIEIINKDKLSIMTPEEMKIAWEETRKCLYSKDQEIEYLKTRIINGKNETGLKRLALRYRMLSIVAFIFVIACAFVYPPLFGEKSWILPTVVMMIYFSTCAIMDFWLYKGITSIDCQTMNVNEVIRLSGYYKKKHLQFVMILLPFAFVTVGVFIYSLNLEPEMVKAIIIGLIVGLTLGIKMFISFMHDYKNIERSSYENSEEL